MNYSNKYRVLKSSWGIAIDIAGNLKEIDSTENIICISNNSLAENERIEILSGLQTVLDDLHQKKYSIEIIEVKFNDSDFQMEALYWASRDWLSKALGIDMPAPEIIFNSKENKYVFKLA